MALDRTKMTAKGNRAVARSLAAGGASGRAGARLTGLRPNQHQPTAVSPAGAWQPVRHIRGQEVAVRMATSAGGPAGYSDELTGVPDEALELIMTKLVEEKGARQALNDRPIATLSDWGLDIPAEFQEKYRDSTLVEIYQDQYGVDSEEAQLAVPLIAAPLVVVATRGTKPATNSRTASHVKSGVTTVTKSGTTTATAVAVGTIFTVQREAGLEPEPLPPDVQRRLEGLTGDREEAK